MSALAVRSKAAATVHIPPTDLYAIALRETASEPIWRKSIEKTERRKSNVRNETAKA
jgi:hypothetical protein